MFAFKQFCSDTEVLHSDLDVVAAIVTSSNSVNIVGRVLYQGEPATNARVWCVARNEAGNRFTPTNSLISAGGHFRLEGLPVEIAIQDSEVRVYAHATLPTLFRACPKSACF